MHPGLYLDDLERLLDYSELGVTVTDIDGYIELATPRITEITGYTERELIGNNPKVFKSGQTPTQTYRELWQKISSGDTWKGPLLNRRKSGTYFIDREVIIPRKDARGHWSTFMAIHREAKLEMDLRVKLGRAEKRINLKEDEVEAAKSQVSSLLQVTTEQAEGISNALVASMEARDHYTAGHGLRTSMLIDAVGTQLGLFQKYSQDAIRLGAILHDIGKIGIPDSILHKPGKLTDVEFAAMRSHPAIGFEILKHVIKSEETLRIVRHHHERMSGSGYPDGLHGSDLPEYVRAFSVCDCFDALTSKRSYRNEMTPDQALDILTEEANSGLLDKATVRVLRRLWIAGDLNELLAIRSAT